MDFYRIFEKILFTLTSIIFFGVGVLFIIYSYIACIRIETYNMFFGSIIVGLCLYMVLISLDIVRGE